MDNFKDGFEYKLIWNGSILIGNMYKIFYLLLIDYKLWNFIWKNICSTETFKKETIIKVYTIEIFKPYQY